MSNLLDSSVISEYWKYYLIDNSSEFFTYNIFPFLCHQFYFYLFNFPYILFFIFKFKFVEKYYIHRVMEIQFLNKENDEFTRILAYCKMCSCNSLFGGFTFFFDWTRHLFTNRSNVERITITKFVYHHLAIIHLYDCSGYRVLLDSSIG
jgi:hypothetical protein